MYSSPPQEIKHSGVKATVVRLKTRDGLMELDAAKVQVGDEYIVYPATTQWVKGYNLVTNREHRKLMTFCDGVEGRHAGFLPTECLDWIGKEKVLRKLEIVH